MVKIKLDLEKAALIVFFAVFLFIGPGALFDHRIKHDFPYAYFSSDSFQHQTRAEAIKDAGNFRYEAPYIIKGFKDAVGIYPPAIYHLAAVLSYSAGIEVYDSIYFLVVFFAIIASCIMYLVIRNFNKTVALLSLPMSLLILSSPPATGFLWGHWPSVLSQSFLIFFFWSIIRIDLDKSWIIIAVAMSAVFLTHTSEAIFAILFLAMFFGAKLIGKSLSKQDIRGIALSFGAFFALSFYYIVIFLNTWAKAQPFSFAVEPVWNGNPGFYIAGFGLLLIPIVFGLIFSLPKLKEAHVSVILAFAMLIAGLLNYIGFGLRSFQIRFFWPIYLSVLFGFGVYIIGKPIIKKWNFAYSSFVFIVLIAAFSGFMKLPVLKQTDVQAIPYIPQVSIAANSGIMDPFHWEALNWLADNSEDNATMYFFYGDIYSQDALLRNAKRVHYQVDPGDFINSIQERKIKKVYITELPGDTGGTISHRVSFFKFEDYAGTVPVEFHFGPKDICGFGYYVFDKVSRQEALAQYNLLIAQELLKKEYINPVFENQVVAILRNNNVGGDCIEERIF